MTSMRHFRGAPRLTGAIPLSIIGLLWRRAREEVQGPLQGRGEHYCAADGIGLLLLARRTPFRREKEGGKIPLLFAP